MQVLPQARGSRFPEAKHVLRGDIRKHNDDLTAFLRALAADLVAQNVNQHQQTQQAAKAWAREQVAFNLSG